MKLVGMVLLIAGILSLVYHGFTYTTHKKVLDVGPIQATKQEHHAVPIPPILGALAVIGGVAVLVVDRRNSP